MSESKLVLCRWLRESLEQFYVAFTVSCRL